MGSNCSIQSDRQYRCIFLEGSQLLEFPFRTFRTWNNYRSVRVVSFCWCVNTIINAFSSHSIWLNLCEVRTNLIFHQTIQKKPRINPSPQNHLAIFFDSTQQSSTFSFRPLKHFTVLPIFWYQLRNLQKFFFLELAAFPILQFTKKTKFCTFVGGPF